MARTCSDTLDLAQEADNAPPQPPKNAANLTTEEISETSNSVCLTLKRMANGRVNTLMIKILDGGGPVNSPMLMAAMAAKTVPDQDQEKEEKMVKG